MPRPSSLVAPRADLRGLEVGMQQVEIQQAKNFALVVKDPKVGQWETVGFQRRRPQ